MRGQIYEKYPPCCPAQAKAKNYICREKIPVLRAVVLIGTVVLLFSSCYDKGDCLITNSNLINIGLKKRTNSSLDTTISFLSVRVIGLAEPIQKRASGNKLSLPVDPGKTETTFVIHRYYLNKTDTVRPKPDTLKFTYRNETTIPTVNCPALSFQKDVKLQKSTYDTTLFRIVNTDLLKDATNFNMLF